MLLKRTYKVAGHVFSLSMEGEDRAWGALGNYDPFVIDETEELFSLEVVPEFDKRSLWKIGRARTASNAARTPSSIRVADEQGDWLAAEKGMT